MIKKELGGKREFSTGAKKQAASGKGTPVLFPGDAYIAISQHFEDGAIVYDARNWEKGIPLSKLVDSLERHIAQFKMNMVDESHLRAIGWNAVVLLATKLRIENGLLPKELDDMPKYVTTSVEELTKELHVEEKLLRCNGADNPLCNDKCSHRRSHKYNHSFHQCFSPCKNMCRHVKGAKCQEVKNER